MEDASRYPLSLFHLEASFVLYREMCIRDRVEVAPSDYPGGTRKLESMILATKSGTPIIGQIAVVMLSLIHI